MNVRNPNGASTGPGDPSGSPEGGADGPDERPGSPRPLGVVAASAVNGVRTLLRKQVELARIEVVEAATTRAMGAGMMGGAAVMGVFGVLFAAAAGAAALAIVLPTWAAILTVAAVFFLVAAVLALIGRRSVRTARPATERTKETLKEDARWARQQIAR
jgi:hypothetical protein